MQGGGEGDPGVSLADGQFPVKIEKNQEGFTGERMPRKARWYRVYWGAITVGDLYVTLIPTAEGYGMRSAIRSKGIAKVVSNWKSDSGATMRIQEDGKYVPIRFKTSFELRKRTRKIDIHWDKDWKVVKETNIPPENRHKRPAVPEEQKIGSFDPLTAVMQGRLLVREAILSGKREFFVPVYDGRRKSNIRFKIYGADKNGIIHTSFVEEAVSGYTNNELKEIAKNNPEFHVYLSPKDLLPVAAKGQSLLGTARIKLKMECDTLKECQDAGEAS